MAKTQTQSRTFAEEVFHGRPNHSIDRTASELDAKIAQLEKIRELAPYVLANGVLNDALEDGWPSVAERVTALDPQFQSTWQEQQAVQRKVSELIPGKLGEEIADEIGRVAFYMMSAHQRSAYHLGLAVGMAVGPNGLTRGER